ncbi:MAG: hypothetical protein RH945_02440 [Hyphomonas sp.]
MKKFSLYDSMREHGTLAESAKEVPDARFALPATINWMRALAIIIKDQKLDFGKSQSVYGSVTRRSIRPKELNSVGEQLLFSLNQLAALKALSAAPNKSDIARVAIVTWYYGVYGSASAMLAAADGSAAETHASTAKQWDHTFPSRNLAIPPFSDRISDIQSTTIDGELAPLKLRGTSSLTIRPSAITEAWGCVNEYLSGTTKWEQFNIQSRVKNTPEFRALGVNNFRTKAARIIRDKAFQARSISFLHQASRYRGKANYRDAIYLAYGKNVPKIVDDLADDLIKVSTAFSCMAAAYCSKRLGAPVWGDLLSDLDSKQALSLSASSVWS